MAFYAVRRLGAIVVILVVMSMLVFLATHAMPQDTARVILGEYATPDSLVALQHQLGLDRPLAVQYWGWAAGLLRGDMGRSMVMERPVAPMLWAALGRSAVIAVAAMLAVTVLGIGLGVLAAVRHGRPLDHLISVLAYVGLSVPEFFWGLLLILLLGLYLGWLPTSGYGVPGAGAWSYVGHMVLPVVTLTIGLLAHVIRMTRSSMLEAMGSGFVRAARARGMPERIVVLRHALRNAMLPTITVLAQDFGFLVGGIVAVETIFAYPGLGQLLMFSLDHHDLPLMQAAILVITSVYCLANLAADLLYGVFNPRIRYGGAVE
jgi:peptide/nickel transport system permease protein